MSLRPCYSPISTSARTRSIIRFPITAQKRKRKDKAVSHFFLVFIVPRRRSSIKLSMTFERFFFCFFFSADLETNQQVNIKFDDSNLFIVEKTEQLISREKSCLWLNATSHSVYIHLPFTKLTGLPFVSSSFSLSLSRFVSILCHIEVMQSRQFFSSFLCVQLCYDRSAFCFSP